jgi:hypothetical protein
MVLSSEHRLEVGAKLEFPTQLETAWMAITSAVSDADEKERALRDLIRADLRRHSGRPIPAAERVQLPAGRPTQGAVGSA